jgi:endonuclease/exonuclease/phosphatase family metal-dependent hydrolase
MKIRVATYNIHKGVSSIRSTPRVVALKEAIGLFDANVVFLQEVQGRHDQKAAKFGETAHGHRHWPEKAQHEFFAGESHHVAYGMNAVYDHGHHGNALLSSYPICHSHNHDVSDHAFEQRGILHCAASCTARSSPRPASCTATSSTSACSKQAGGARPRPSSRRSIRRRRTANR